jgi:hypothetical protein
VLSDVNIEGGVLTNNGAFGFNPAGNNVVNGMVSGVDLTQNTSGAVNALGTGWQLRGNPGYNPVGDLGAIAVTASPFTYTDSDSVDEMVYVSGGVVTAITVNGSATGLTAGGFLVPAGKTIVVTYTGTPVMRKNGL